jgi:hypothetical protein
MGPVFQAKFVFSISYHINLYKIKKTSTKIVNVFLLVLPTEEISKHLVEDLEKISQLSVSNIKNFTL